MNSGGKRPFYYVQEGIRMTGEMLERRFITINTDDSFHFVEYLGRRKETGISGGVQEVSLLQSVQKT